MSYYPETFNVKMKLNKTSFSLVGSALIDIVVITGCFDC